MTDLVGSAPSPAKQGSVSGCSCGRGPGTTLRCTAVKKQRARGRHINKGSTVRPVLSTDTKSTCYTGTAGQVALGGSAWGLVCVRARMRVAEAGTWGF